MRKACLFIFILVLSVRADQNLEKIFGKIPTIAKTDIAKINDWLLQEKDLVASLVVQNGALIDCGVLQKKNNELLKAKGIINYARTNYVFVCPAQPNYMIKISGPLNRLVNIVSANNKSTKTITDDEIKALKRIVTHQTISSLPTYYLYLRLNKILSLKHVYIPKTYLLKLPQASDVLADTNYVIVQERVELLQKPVIAEQLKKLNNDQIKELVAVIACCGLWDIKGKIHIDKKGRLVIVDLEQPNVSNSLKGFNIQEKDRFYHNVQCGLDSLMDMFKNKADLIDECAENFISLQKNKKKGGQHVPPLFI